MTGEKTLPVLDAAHIKPYAIAGNHEISNGILLRSDLHTLFDRGYLGINPDDHTILVSPRIREQFENGRHYYALDGQRIALPQIASAQPSRDSLAYHLDNIYA